EGLKDAVLIQVEEELMILAELHEHGSVAELDVLVVELRERCGGRGCCWGRRKRLCVAENRSAGSKGRAALEESSTVWLGHDGIHGIPLVDYNLLARVSNEITCMRVGPLHGKPVVALRRLGDRCEMFRFDRPEQKNLL